MDIYKIPIANLTIEQIEQIIEDQIAWCSSEAGKIEYVTRILAQKMNIPTYHSQENALSLTTVTPQIWNKIKKDKERLYDKILNGTGMNNDEFGYFISRVPKLRNSVLHMNTYELYKGMCSLCTELKTLETFGEFLQRTYKATVAFDFESPEKFLEMISSRESFLENAVPAMDFDVNVGAYGQNLHACTVGVFNITTLIFRLYSTTVREMIQYI